MKLTGIYICFLFVLQTVLGASLPEFAGPFKGERMDGDASLTQVTGLQARAPGEIQVLESRQAAIILLALANAVLAIMHNLTKDDEGRRKFTQQTVQEGRKTWPEYNWVICHPKHTTKFDGTEGAEWGHLHHEYDLIIGGTIGYDIYWFTSGKFERDGDGGFLNWAYFGDVISTSNNGATVEFA
ncbi:hypothetical protein DFP72DRAFT_938164 [Ephemerocybe angulata]|uniref:DUF7888 domain-containing protein n=1 Tax=Ephemerocybe angulata TaxID=980116 RepID=A0A8H6HAT0_9AGAR|nr:hypothetical protein DFP72DRAFT_938164 [Tulosesus angulatus]